MRGKDGGGKDCGFKSASGKNRKCYGHGALTDAGNILDGKYTAVRHEKPRSAASSGEIN
jgi:hypothetical protein